MLGYRSLKFCFAIHSEQWKSAKVEEVALAKTRLRVCFDSEFLDCIQHYLLAIKDFLGPYCQLDLIYGSINVQLDNFCLFYLDPASKAWHNFLMFGSDTVASNPPNAKQHSCFYPYIGTSWCAHHHYCIVSSGWSNGQCCWSEAKPFLQRIAPFITVAFKQLIGNIITIAQDWFFTDITVSALSLFMSALMSSDSLQREVSIEAYLSSLIRRLQVVSLQYF